MYRFVFVSTSSTGGSPGSSILGYTLDNVTLTYEENPLIFYNSYTTTTGERNQLANGQGVLSVRDSIFKFEEEKQHFFYFCHLFTRIRAMENAKPYKYNPCTK